MGRRNGICLYLWEARGASVPTLVAACLERSSFFVCRVVAVGIAVVTMKMGGRKQFGKRKCNIKHIKNHESMLLILMLALALNKLKTNSFI